MSTNEHKWSSMEPSQYHSRSPSRKSANSHVQTCDWTGNVLPNCHVHQRLSPSASFPNGSTTQSNGVCSAQKPTAPKLVLDYLLGTITEYIEELLSSWRVLVLILVEEPFHRFRVQISHGRRLDGNPSLPGQSTLPLAQYHLSHVTCRACTCTRCRLRYDAFK